MVRSSFRESKNGITLMLYQKKMIFDHIIETCYTGKLSIDAWSLDDLIELSELSDMYQIKHITINILEPYFIEHLTNMSNSLTHTDQLKYLEGLADRYELKNLIVTIHNIFYNRTT
jgi:hypothetical protein